MKKPFKVQCREATYDISSEMLVLLCFFEEFGESRLVHFSRSDFHYKDPGNPVPHIEMHRTAELFKGKRFSIVIEDDPNRNKEADINPEAMGEDFTKLIEAKLEAISDGLSDSQRIMARKLGDIIEKDIPRRKSMGDLLADEMLIRAQLKDIKFE